MQTRIEKYKSYREEIAKLNNFTEEIENSNKELNDFKTKINKINTSILHINNVIEPFNPLTDSIECPDQMLSLSNKFVDFTKVINDVKINSYKQKKDEYFKNFDKNKIINSDGDFNHDWLINNPNFLFFEDKIKNKKENFETHLKDSSTILQDKAKKLQSEDNGVVLQQMKLINIDSQKKITKHWKNSFISIWMITLLILLLSFVVLMFYIARK